MAVFKYTFKKFSKQTSTWVVMLVAFGLLFLVSGYLVFGQIDYKTVSQSSYLTRSMIFYAGFMTMSSIFISIFAGFKGASVFRDEVSDGTFLIVLSKPQTRAKIVFQKWLAYSTINILFIFTCSIALLLAVVIFDKPDAANSSDIWSVSVKKNLFSAWGILFSLSIVIMLIFSSISLLISTKLGVGGTIGITIVIGIAIFFSSFIGLFSEKASYNTSFISSNSISSREISENFAGNSIINDSLFTGQVMNIYEDPTDPTKPTGTQTLNSKDDFIAYYAKTYSQIFSTDFATYAIDTNIKASYNFFSYFDLNYQIQQLGVIAIDVAVPANALSDAISFAANSRTSGAPGTSKKQVEIAKVSEADIDTDLNYVSSLSVSYSTDIAAKIFPSLPSSTVSGFLPTWTSLIDLPSLESAASEINIDTSAITQGITSNEAKIVTILKEIAKQGNLSKIKYEDFVNKYGILIAYLVIALIFIPTSYFVVRRQDFR